MKEGGATYGEGYEGKTVPGTEFISTELASIFIEIEKTVLGISEKLLLFFLLQMNYI